MAAREVSGVMQAALRSGIEKAKGSRNAQVLLSRRFHAVSFVDQQKVRF